MKFHVLANNSLITSVADLKRHILPRVVSKKPTDSELNDLEIFVVQTANKPAVADGEIAEINTMPDHVSGVSTLHWTVRDMTAQEIADADDARRQAMVAGRGQFAIACARADVITFAEALAWGPGNALPSAVDTAIQNTLTTDDERNEARVTALSANTIRRTHPLVDLIRAALSLTEDEADDIFAAAIALEQA